MFVFGGVYEGVLGVDELYGVVLCDIVLIVFRVFGVEGGLGVEV